jgi:hypothetical protein
MAKDTQPIAPPSVDTTPLSKTIPNVASADIARL